MSTTNIGNQTIVRLCYLNQLFDISRMRCSHLYDSELMLFCELEQRERHSERVVVIALCVVDVIFGLEHSGCQFLGGRFTIGTRDSDNG